ncbi:MAG TPA: hypothetical protein DCE71_01115 [Parachlamydiales bacterium]|nr:hypothetical protein [Parachlamydiales bacterium]
MEWGNYLYFSKICIFSVSYFFSLLYFIPRGVSILNKWSENRVYKDLTLGIGFLFCGLFILIYLLGTLLVSYAFTSQFGI